MLARCHYLWGTQLNPIKSCLPALAAYVPTYLVNVLTIPPPDWVNALLY